MAVHSDYVQKFLHVKAKNTFSTSFDALRELFDGSKAPEKTFNR